MEYLSTPDSLLRWNLLSASGTPATGALSLNLHGGGTAPASSSGGPGGGPGGPGGRAGIRDSFHALFSPSLRGPSGPGVGLDATLSPSLLGPHFSPSTPLPGSAVTGDGRSVGGSGSSVPVTPLLGGPSGVGHPPRAPPSVSAAAGGSGAGEPVSVSAAAAAAAAAATAERPCTVGAAGGPLAVASAAVAALGEPLPLPSLPATPALAEAGPNLWSSPFIRLSGGGGGGSGGGGMPAVTAATTVSASSSAVAGGAYRPPAGAASPAWQVVLPSASPLPTPLLSMGGGFGVPMAVTPRRLLPPGGAAGGGGGASTNPSVPPPKAEPGPPDAAGGAGRRPAELPSKTAAAAAAATTTAAGSVGRPGTPSSARPASAPSAPVPSAPAPSAAASSAPAPSAIGRGDPHASQEVHHGPPVPPFSPSLLAAVSGSAATAVGGMPATVRVVPNASPSVSSSASLMGVVPVPTMNLAAAASQQAHMQSWQLLYQQQPQHAQLQVHSRPLTARLQYACRSPFLVDRSLLAGSGSRGGGGAPTVPRLPPPPPPHSVTKAPPPPSPPPPPPAPPRHTPLAPVRARAARPGLSAFSSMPCLPALANLSPSATSGPASVGGGDMSASPQSSVPSLGAPAGVASGAADSHMRGTGGTPPRMGSAASAPALDVAGDGDGDGDGDGGSGGGLAGTATAAKGKDAAGVGNGDRDGEKDNAASKKQSRAEALLRFQQKRRRRTFAKSVRYTVRKALADGRPRVKGRFVKSAGPDAAKSGPAAAATSNTGGNASAGDTVAGAGGGGASEALSDEDEELSPPVSPATRLAALTPVLISVAGSDGADGAGGDVSGAKRRRLSTAPSGSSMDVVVPPTPLPSSSSTAVAAAAAATGSAVPFGFPPPLPPPAP
ncbi:hypothetical protein MMPV_009268 [Pyropia vietnamensis]